ncbi:phage tail protein [Haloplanus halophilus]|uniref:phage tail protein n=1 Tax=Haloplanus halophilus TaxID=2949993 RepID=UPI00203B5507|nr:phage tail protein [Haloplanus sp. GDY1]
MTDRPVDPYLRHRFDVDLGDDRPPLGFTEVTGLSVRVQARPADGDEGAPDWFDWLDRPGRALGAAPTPERRRTDSPPLRLRRGVTDDRRLWDWLRDWVDGAVEARDVCVFLLDDAGDRARGWRCRAATPLRWAGPKLAADRPDVATETLELAHEGIDAIDA